MTSPLETSDEEKIKMINEFFEPMNVTTRPMRRSWDYGKFRVTVTQFPDQQTERPEHDK